MKIQNEEIDPKEITKYQFGHGDNAPSKLHLWLTNKRERTFQAFTPEEKTKLKSEYSQLEEQVEKIRAESKK
jgi:hypothetical protein